MSYIDLLILRFSLKKDVCQREREREREREKERERESQKESQTEKEERQRDTTDRWKDGLTGKLLLLCFESKTQYLSLEMQTMQI